mmetsp:Transcript_67401/g.75500  ORF Transcript_67401/g.75500 Transcript_67401/m.75500 type:complete len:86 (-) Transcript_67401:48-305(-)
MYNSNTVQYRPRGLVYSRVLFLWAPFPPEETLFVSIVYFRSTTVAPPLLSFNSHPPSSPLKARDDSYYFIVEDKSNYTMVPLCSG